MSNKYLERARQMRSQLDNITKDFDDEKALDNKELYPDWNGNGIQLSVGSIVYYNNNIYRVLQAHKTQADWTPDVAVSLFVKISIDEFPEWVQPTGAHDAYKKGDKVTYNDDHWQSAVDNNVWQPGVYGWEKL